jgi:UDP-glucose 4-epimerase
MTSNRIIVTGGTGYIGSHTVVALQQAGFEVIIIDSLERSHESVLERIELITGHRPQFYHADMRDGKALTEVFNKESDIAGVIHFAAYKAVGESMQIPFEYYQNNITSLINLLSEMRTHKIPNLVFSSSCAVYGDSEILPVTESMPLGIPTSPYGNTKKQCEEIIRDSAAECGIQSINLRYFNPVGAHPSALIGEWPVGAPNNLFPYVTQVAAGKREKLTVFGNDYPTPDGSCVRDYIHVTDVAEAHVIALQRLLKGQNPQRVEVFNLGTGTGVSVLEILETFEKVIGKKVNYVIGPRRPGDVAAVYADPAKAEKELGWRAKESLESMVSSAWKWEQQLA